jgi:hypothetical protein
LQRQTGAALPYVKHETKTKHGESKMFKIELQRHGAQMWRAECKAERAALRGVYALLNGKTECLLPNSQALRELLPYQYRKAFDRAALWWTQEHSDVIRMDLRDYRGFPMGSLFAQFNQDA